MSAANTPAGASELGGTILGVSSKSGTLKLQMSPVEAKVAFAFLPNCSSARKITLLAKEVFNFVSSCRPKILEKQEALARKSAEED
jgi:hypothetical protein